MRRSLLLGTSLAVLLAGCAESAPPGPGGPGGGGPVADVPASDLEPYESGKADGVVFDANRLLEDAAFADASALDVAEVQAFFEATPYGRASFLATYVEGGRTAAELVVAAARRHAINPLVLLVKLQVEMSLISSAERPSSRRLAAAMGCACPDGAACDTRQAGFAAQLDCAGALFAEYLWELAHDGQTRSGWQVGRARRTSDGVRVTPANASTAALYTYTPWVLRGQGGNWLFWNVLQRYRDHLGALTPNRGWIGGACEGDATCAYEGGLCLHGSPGGLCSRECDRYCPDVSSPGASVTFCVDLGALMGGGASEGYCVSRCDAELYPATGGCREGYRCVDAPRFGDPSFWADVCWPAF